MLKTWHCEKVLTYLRISEQDTHDDVGVISGDITEKVIDRWTDQSLEAS